MSHSKQDILNQISAMKTWRIGAETAAVGKGFSDVSTAHDISTFAGEFGGCYPGQAGLHTYDIADCGAGGITAVPVTIHAKSAYFNANNNATVTSGTYGPGEVEYVTTDVTGHTPNFSGAPSFCRIQGVYIDASGNTNVKCIFAVKRGV